MCDQGDPCCHTSVRRVSRGVLLRNSRLVPGGPTQTAFCLSLCGKQGSLPGFPGACSRVQTDRSSLTDVEGLRTPRQGAEWLRIL